MQGVLFGLFRDLDSAEKALIALRAAGIADDATSLHRQDVPVAGTHEERPHVAAPHDQPGPIADLFSSLFGSSGEMDTSANVTTVRQALHRGEYAVSIGTRDPHEMTTAERIFKESGAVLQLHPDADA